ncbi:MAG: radical SAM protein [Clostridia bacterium]|nr:radical SAM protein [Clostridia bacterium]
MNKVMLLYPPGRLYQRSEDRAQCNISDSAAISVHACNDLGYCAAVLLKRGFQVFLKDYQTAGLSFDDAAADVRSFQPDMIVLSTTNTSVIDDAAFLHRLTRIHPCVCVMKGAVFFDLSPDRLAQLDLSAVSCLVCCEIEFMIDALASYYLRNEGSLADLNGIMYKENGDFVKTPFVCAQNDLDSLPFPARQLMDNALYVRPDTGEPMATIQTGLGCPSGCIYCLTPLISGRNVRTRSVDNVYREIEECYYTFGIRNFFFRADTFTIDNEWAQALCDRIIDSPLCGKIAFTANSRVKPLSAELLKKMKAAGCFTVAVGFESGSEETLSRIKKGATRADNLRAAKIIKAAGIPLFGFFIIGFPWESERHIKDTASLIREISPDFIELHIAMPFYGTMLYRECEAAGTLTGSAFGNDVYAPNTTGTLYLSTEELQKWKRRILLRFYTKPGYILKQFSAAIGKPVVIGNYIRYGVKLVLNNTVLKKKHRSD